MRKRMSLCPQCGSDAEALASDVLFCPRCRFPLVWVGERYRLRRKLAEGGFGRVYEARWGEADAEETCALKIFHPEILDPALSGEEERATRILRRLRRIAEVSVRSTHLVQRKDDAGGEPALGWFYGMELVKGITAEQWLQRQGLPSQTEALALMRQVCRAMQVAHAAGVVHLDLKPSNVMLVQEKDGGMTAKVLDLGITSLLAEAAPRDATLGLLGSPAYMAPEQCLRAPLDERADVYALGVFLYELLAGMPPFVERPGEFVSLLEAHVCQEPTSLRERRPDTHIPEALDRVVLQALQKNPRDRYPSVEAFWNAIVDAVPEHSLAPLAPVHSDENCGVDPDERARRDEALQAQIQDAARSFSLGIAHDYGWGKVKLTGQSEEGGMVPGAVEVRADLPVAEGAQEEPLQAPALQPPQAPGGGRPPLQGRRRGMVMLAGSALVLAVMWILTECTTPPLPPSVSSPKPSTRRDVAKRGAAPAPRRPVRTRP